MIVYNVFVLFQSFSIKRVQYLKQLRPMSRGRERCHTRRRAAAEGSGSSAEEGHWSFAKPSCFPKLSTPHSKMWVCKMWVCIQEGEFPTRKTIYYGFSLLLIFSDGCPYSTHRLSLLDGGENQLLSVSRGGLPNTDPLVRQAQETLGRLHLCEALGFSDIDHVGAILHGVSGSCNQLKALSEAFSQLEPGVVLIQDHKGV